MNKDYIDWERENYERRKTRNERKRDRRYRLALILAVVVWLVVLAYVPGLPASHGFSEETNLGRSYHFEELETQTGRDQLKYIVSISNTNKEAEEPVVITYPYYDVPMPRDLQDDLRCACDEFGVDMVLMLSLIRRESSFQNVMGDGGNSYGYCQIQPRWWSGLMEEIGAKDLMCPLDNFRTACAIISGFLEEYTLEDALTLYNSGSPGKSEYADSIMKGVSEINEA